MLWLGEMVRFYTYLLLVECLLQPISASINSLDATALLSLKSEWENIPPSWQGSDPCSSKWDGVTCANSHVTSLTLPSMGIKGALSDVSSLTELQTLDLSYNKDLTGPLPSSIGSLKKLTSLILLGCGLSGPIPDEIGNLQQLTFLALNSNSFTGKIPPSIGNLVNLYWLDLADNKLTGSLPVSNGTSPGLGSLIKARHFHLNKNQLSGPIAPQLFNPKLKLIHILLDDNQLTGTIPDTLGLVQTLQIVRLDRNSLEGQVPSNIKNLTQVQELHLSNNKLSGSLPNLSGLNLLSYVDLSNNSFDSSYVPPWLTTLEFLTTLVMEQIKIQGELPQALFSFPQLQRVILRRNYLNGTLNLGQNYSRTLQLVDLQYNNISGYTVGDGYLHELILTGNPICQHLPLTYCSSPQEPTPYSTPMANCSSPRACPVDRKISPACKCAYPFQGVIIFRAPFFSDLRNETRFHLLEQAILLMLQSYGVAVAAPVYLQDIQFNGNGYLQVGVEIYPGGDQESFTRQDILRISSLFSNQTFQPPPEFGPAFFIASPYIFESTHSKSPSLKTTVAILAAVGALFLLLLLCLLSYALRRRRAAENASDSSDALRPWNSSRNYSSSAPQLKGSRWFTYDELKKCTNNFSEANGIGAGGYGRVYRGTLQTGQMVAIKRAKQGSMQGGHEFKTEIELLSRVHHKNLVALVGFCLERQEQMLVYEYVPNGSLKDSLMGRSGIHLGWSKRLSVVLGVARGLAYLHELASPPIVHRDVKSNNILLDENLNGKVADFGLSKPLGDMREGPIATHVRGTMGYVDPEYYMSQQLTKKSDVYSFGVVMLEIVTARRPLERGRYIVREVRSAMDRTKDLYGLHGLLDPTVGMGSCLIGFERFVDLALRCVAESAANRPTMSEAVREIESILHEEDGAHANSASTSATLDDNGRSGHPYKDPEKHSFGSNGRNSLASRRGEPK